MTPSLPGFLGLTLALAAIAAAPTASVADAGPAPAGLSQERRSYVPGELVVRFASGSGAAARAAVRGSLAARRLRALPVPGLQVVKLRRGASVRAAAAAFERDPRVLYAEPNYLYELSALPNDPRFSELWGLDSTGQNIGGAGGAADADIDAPEAWQTTTGTGSVTVAVVDSGMAYDHPDLSANLWKNPGESGSGRERNGKDDDRDGLVDDWRGWDFLSNDNDPRDHNGHGTHVAGTIGARGNNGIGAAGVNWRVKLMPLRVADGNGVVAGSAVISAFDYAAAKGARVVNASFGSSGFSQAMLDSIRRNSRTLFVAAAGNGGDDGVSDDNDKAPQYPCAFSAPNLVCVAASNRSDQLAQFSNYGARTVDLAAPGNDVLSVEPAYGAPILSEGFESDTAGSWVTGGVNNSWARIATIAHGGSSSLSDSPAATYLDDTDSFARTAATFSLAGRVGCRLSYAVRLATESGNDKLGIEVSRDDSNWAALSSLSGSTEGQFVELTDDMSELDGEPALYLRFHLSTNGSVIADGAQLDDVSVNCLSSSFTGGELAFRDGTSMATPHVAGVAALILSEHPTLGSSGVKDALLRGAERKPAFAGKTVTGGRLNARRALNEARRLVPSLGLTGPKTQHSLDKGIVVYALCTQTCALVATGKVSTSRSAKRSAKLKAKGLKVTRSLRAGRRSKLVMKLSRSTRAAVKRSFERGRRVTVLVSALASDRFGNAIRARREVRLKR